MGGALGMWVQYVWTHWAQDCALAVVAPARGHPPSVGHVGPQWGPKVGQATIHLGGGTKGVANNARNAMRQHAGH